MGGTSEGDRAVGETSEGDRVVVHNYVLLSLKL